MEETVLDALVREVEGCAQFTRHSEEAPMVIFWPDAERLWASALPRLRSRLPQLVTLGPRDPTTRTGPAPWIRGVLAGRTEPRVDPRQPTIVYLPGVGRDDLRAVDECPGHLQLLAGIQHRGKIWAQSNGRDWTPLALLASEKLKVARDDDTLEALRNAVPELLVTPVATLRGHELRGDDFRQLLVRDPELALLQWLDDPAGTASRATPAVWNTLRTIAKQGWQLDLEKEGPDVAAQRLCAAKGPWEKLWAFFAKSHGHYLRVVERLHGVALPTTPSFDDRARYPKFNSKAEDDLRTALLALGSEGIDPVAASASVTALEKQHGARREWLWEHPLADALAHLVQLSAAVSDPMSGTSPQAMADQWMAEGWRADLAALDALAAVRRDADRAAVSVAVQRLYADWLNEGAQRFQKLVAAQEFPGYAPGAEEPVTVSSGEALFFADGLRYDVAMRVAERLEARGLQVQRGSRWIGMPSVTATSKPAASPVVDDLDGSMDGKDFNPHLRVASKPTALTSDLFRKLLMARGYTPLGEAESGDGKGRAYLEYGSLDKEGHSLQAQLPSRIAQHIDSLVDRIESMFAAGWKRLRLLTDHGWVLLPEGLPKVSLPAHAHDDKWGRCAVLKAAPAPPEGMTTLRWRWRPTVTIVAAPGVGIFYAGSCYAHGGLSIQECLTPDFVIARAASAAPSDVTITWKRLLCVVKVGAGYAGLRFDLRQKANDPGSSLLDGAEPLDLEGKAKVAVPDDHTGKLAYAILADPQGNVVFTTQTTIPEG